jgi:hypothetical protein
MQNSLNQQKPGTTIVVGTKLLIFGAIVVALILLTVGAATGKRQVAYAGDFILPFSLFWAGFYLKEEGTAMRIAFIAVAGMITISSLLGLSTLTSLLGR